MKIRFKNANILSMNNSTEIIKGELWTDEGKISFIGTPTAEQIEAVSFNRVIDAEGNLLMPGFKNAHTHSPMTFLRSYADDLPLEEWLFNRVFPMEAKLTADDVYVFTKLAILEYLSGGVTAAFDMYYEPDAIAKACVEYGFRMVFCGAVNNFKESTVKLEEYYDRFNEINPLISYRLGFHAEYTTSLDLMNEISELANSKKAPVFVHNSETQNEVNGCLERYNMTPTELMDSIGMFNYGGGGFHSVVLSDNDIEIYKKRGICAVTNPASNLKLASGAAPIQKYLDNGIKLAIGTDGPASNNSLNMWKEMYLVTALQKLVTGDATACAAEKVLEMATTGGAGAMGLSDSDVLLEGKNADIIMIDMKKPNMQPINAVAKNLVYSGSDSNVKLTMINGKILYENGEFFTGENIEDVYSEANERLEKIKKL